MLLKRTLGIVFLIVLLSPIFVQNLVLGQSTQSYCPQLSDEKYCHKVIIIGAGMAGLGAAKELQSHGYDFVVLEANSDPGGRVVTIPVCDLKNNCYSYDTHASFISGYQGNPIYTLAKYYNITGSIHTQISDYGNSVTLDEAGNVIDDEKQNRMQEIYDNFTSWMNEKRKNNSVDEPLQNVITEFNGTLHNETDQKYFAFEIGNYIGNEYADDPSNMSLLYWDKIGYKPGGENNPDMVFTHGFFDIVRGLVNEIPSDSIRYDTSVTQVNYDEQGVKIETNNGTYYGEYVISTIPIWVLKDKSIQFNPPIPEDKSDAIDKMNTGTLAQTYVYFKNGTFWDDVDWLYYVPPLNESGHFTIFENMDHVHHVPMLMAFNYGAYAKDILSHYSKLGEDLQKSLRHMYPQHVSELSMDNMQILYRGDIESYSSIPVNFKVPDDFNLLANPVEDVHGKNRVFFAGEATTWHYPQTTHGAYLTGLREANRIMVTDMGKYPPPSFQENDWRYPKNIGYNSTWSTFPEYVICHPGLILVIKNDTNDTPLCLKKNTADVFFERGIIINPLQPDPAS